MKEWVAFMIVTVEKLVMEIFRTFVPKSVTKRYFKYIFNV